jgi:hypothetical protein
MLLSGSAEVTRGNLKSDTVHAESLAERGKFEDNLQVWLLIKGSIKGDHWPGSLQVIPGELQLRHSMDIRTVEANTWPTRHFGEPDVQILLLSSFEEHCCGCILQHSATSGYVAIESI